MPFRIPAHLAVAVSLLCLTSIPAFSQGRTDQPTYFLTGAFNEVDDSNAAIGHDLSTPPYTAYLIGIQCDGAVQASDRLVGLIRQPDLMKSGSKSLKAIQKSQVEIEAYVHDETDTLIYNVGPVLAASCKASISVKDGDEDNDYDGGTDLLKASLSCGDDLPTLFGLDAGQTAQFVATFGAEPSCKIMGIPSDSGFCFRGDTVVSTDKGPRPIRDLAVGDRVWSFDEASGKEVLQQVTRVFRQPGKNLRAVGAGAETIYTTDGHPFRVEGKGWVKARDLAAGQRLVAHGDAALAVAFNRSIDAREFYAGYVSPDRKSFAKSRGQFAFMHASVSSSSQFGPPVLDDSLASPMVYNIEVSGVHNFFVGKGRILVHNK